jgi:hypothetical protein
MEPRSGNRNPPVSLVKSLLRPDQLAAIGLVAAESSSLEGTVDLTLSILTGLADEECSILFGGKTLGPKLDIVKELGLRRLRSQETKKTLTAIIDLLSSLISERNAVVHGTWQPKDGFTLAYLAQMTKPAEVEAVLRRRNGSVRKVNAENLDELARRLSEAHSALFHFAMDHWIRPVVRRNARREALRKMRRTGVCVPMTDAGRGVPKDLLLSSPSTAADSARFARLSIFLLYCFPFVVGAAG